MSDLWIDNNILYYSDDSKYIEITAYMKIYDNEKSIVLDMDCQWIQWNETYPILFASRKEIFTKEEIIWTINGFIKLLSESSDFSISPIESSILNKFSQDVFVIYGLN